ncbi:MAG: ABC transporter ATP-binding protein [Nitrospirae bacterium]|nr:MAG: ABC transporter ATP-binding protein [Nitrospirota bacterium]
MAEATPPDYLAPDSVAERPPDVAIVRRLGGYLGRRPALVAASLALVALSAAAVTAGPWLLGRAVDLGLVARDRRALLLYALLMLAVQGLRTAASVAEGVLFAKLGQGVLHDLRQDLFARVLSLPLPFFDRNPVGRLVTRLTNDIAALGELFAPSVVSVVVNVVVIAAVSAALVVLDPLLAAAAFLLFPLLVAITLHFGRRIRRVFREVKLRLARINAGLAELIPGMRVVQLFGAEEGERARFTRLNRAFRDAQLRGVRYNAVLHPLVQVCAGATVAGLLLLGGWRVHRGAITVGTLVAFLTYTQHLFQPVRGLIEKYNLFQTAMASAERIFLLLDEPPEADWGEAGAEKLPPRLAGAIRLQGVELEYEGGVPALRGLDLEVAPGEVVALVGPTGAGKSTVASLLLRLYEPTAGTVELDGRPLEQYPKGYLRRRIGLIGQEVFLFDATLRENLCLFREVAPERLAEVVRRVGLEPVVAALPEGLETRLGERGGRLSLGERQLVAFARFLLYDPDLLILDEATASIDRTTERRIQRALAVAAEGRTTLIIAHRLETVRHADRVVVLERGRKVAEGPPETVLAQGLARRALAFSGEGG